MHRPLVHSTCKSNPLKSSLHVKEHLGPVHYPIHVCWCITLFGCYQPFHSLAKKWQHGTWASALSCIYAPMHSVAPNGLTPGHDTMALILHQILCILHLGNPSAPTIGELLTCERTLGPVHYPSILYYKIKASDSSKHQQSPKSAQSARRR